MKSIFDLAYKENLLLDLHLPETDEFDLFVYFHAECDDEFYLVLSKPHTGKILLAYPKKMFDLQQ